MIVLRSVGAPIEPELSTQDYNLFSSLWQLTMNRLLRITMSVLQSMAAHNEPPTQDYNVFSPVCGS